MSEYGGYLSGMWIETDEIDQNGIDLGVITYIYGCEVSRGRFMICWLLLRVVTPNIFPRQRGDPYQLFQLVKNSTRGTLV